MNIRKNWDYILYTLRHKKAFLKVEKQLCGHITIRGIFHDVGKVFGYCLYCKAYTSFHHKLHSRHHIRCAKTKADYIQMIIDWECARYTKLDKPQSAREFLYSNQQQLIPILEPILIELGL